MKAGDPGARLAPGGGAEWSALARQSILAPATCNLLNPDKTQTVEHAFTLLNELSLHMKERYL